MRKPDNPSDKILPHCPKDFSYPSFRCCSAASRSVTVKKARDKQMRGPKSLSQRNEGAYSRLMWMICSALHAESRSEKVDDVA